MANWRKHAVELGATSGTGSWKRRIATALGRTEASTGSWARRIAEGQTDGKSWNRAAEKTIRTDE